MIDYRNEEAFTLGIVTRMKIVTRVTMILERWTSWLETILMEPMKML